MKAALWNGLRHARYRLPQQIGRIVPGPDAAAAARICAKLHRRGLVATIGHFPGEGDDPDDVLAVNIDAVACLQAAPSGTYLSLKAPQLAFDYDRIRSIAAAAAEAGVPLLFDAHAHHQADATHSLVTRLLPDFAGTGLALPVRWQRSAGDAERFYDSTARIRLVKGEWADPTWGEGASDRRYLDLAARLKGRRGIVAIATHDASLAERALTLLLESGTSCELELIRGLPKRRTLAVAERLGVTARIYVSFGAGWLPYAIDKALARPHLLPWLFRDSLARI